MHLPDDREQERLGQLAGYGLSDHAPEPIYDGVVRSAARILDAPIALISIVDRHDQWFKARHGLEIASTPRDHSFCAHAILSPHPMIVADAHLDSRFATNPLVVGEPGIRFYAGAPIVNDQGYALGTLCVIDRRPRPDVCPADLEILADLARTVAATFDARRDHRAREATNGFACSSALAIITTDAAGSITSWNLAAEGIFGHRADGAIGRNIRMIVPDRFRIDHDRGLERVRAGGSPRLAGKVVEVVGLHRDGREFPIEISLSSWTGTAGPGFGAQIQDISVRQARDLRLKHLAEHDPLTGLANRRELRQRLEEVLADDGRATLLALDLDGFKQVNDTLGHVVGDDLLKMVAVRLAARIGEGNVLARMGGDEFAVLLPDCEDPLEARRAGDALASAFDEDFSLGEHELRLATSVGFALAPLHAADPDELLVRADLALIEAKRCGGGRVRIFDRGLENQLAMRRALQDEVRQATLDQEWTLHYQPQVRMDDGTLVGAEALLRWRHPARGLITPDLFLPALEKHAIAQEVGRWVVDEACAQLVRWRACGNRIPRVGVNLFAIQLRLGGIERAVVEALHRHGLSPGDLELELTENIALRQEARSIAELRTLRRMGVHVAFDDFGTGFASLTTIKDFEVDTLKIDRSFVKDLPGDGHSRAIIGGIVHLARELGLGVVAEGIETPEQRDALLSLGCTVGQGFLWGKPGATVDGFREVNVEAPEGFPRRAA